MGWDGWDGWDGAGRGGVGWGRMGFWIGWHIYWMLHKGKDEANAEMRRNEVCGACNAGASRQDDD